MEQYYVYTTIKMHPENQMRLTDEQRVNQKAFQMPDGESMYVAKHYQTLNEIRNQQLSDAEVLARKGSTPLEQHESTRREAPTLHAIYQIFVSPIREQMWGLKPEGYVQIPNSDWQKVEPIRMEDAVVGPDSIHLASGILYNGLDILHECQTRAQKFRAIDTANNQRNIAIMQQLLNPERYESLAMCYANAPHDPNLTQAFKRMADYGVEAASSASVFQDVYKAEYAKIQSHSNHPGPNEMAMAAVVETARAFQKYVSSGEYYSDTKGLQELYSTIEKDYQIARIFAAEFKDEQMRDDAIQYARLSLKPHLKSISSDTRTRLQDNVAEQIRDNYKSFDIQFADDVHKIIAATARTFAQEARDIGNETEAFALDNIADHSERMVDSHDENDGLDTEER